MWRRHCPGRAGPVSFAPVDGPDSGAGGRTGDELRAAAGAFLDAHHVMTLATAGPWAAAVFYVRDGFDLCFVSSPRSRHATLLAADGRVAVTVQDEQAEWRAIQGLQAEGIVEPVPAGEEARVRALYAARFGLLGEIDPSLREALARVRWYRVVPERIWLLDNSLGFGHRERLDLGSLPR